MPIYESGDMWETFGNNSLFCITASGSVTGGQLVMGAGIAAEAKRKIPSISENLGAVIDELKVPDGTYGVAVVYDKYNDAMVAGFQTKVNWHDPPSKEVIQQSVDKLMEFIEECPLDSQRIDLNLPGVGRHGMTQEEVMPLLAKLPNNVHIWTRGRDEHP